MVRVVLQSSGFVVIKGVQVEGGIVFIVVLIERSAFVDIR